MKPEPLIRKIYWAAAALLIFLLAFLASVLFLNPSSVGNENFVRNINLWAALWALTFIVGLVLVFVLARNLIRLFFEFQTGRPGSRIKGKLVATLIIFSLFPALIMSFLAFGLINRNLRLWFNAPSDQLLESSQLIASRFYDQKARFSRFLARSLAEEVDADTLMESSRFVERMRESGFEGVLVADASGRVVSRWGEWPPELLPLEEELSKVLSVADSYWLERQRRPADLDLGLVGVPVRDGQGRLRGAVMAHFEIPGSIAFHAIEIQKAAETYDNLRSGLAQFEVNYFSILALTTLAVIFGFVWLGNYIARKITVPLEALAEGSRRLAEGNLDYQVGVKAVDELGVLVDSFNFMAREIRQSREKLEKANEELRATNVRLDERRLYIETILQNVAAGVMSVSSSEAIQTVNEAALKMLDTTRERILNRTVREVTNSEIYQEFQGMKRRAQLYGTARRDITLQRGENQLHLAVTVTPNPVPLKDEAEFIVVLDDLTELIRAEKFAAWQEVAHRLAHEIKNPLTPIQLSAERVQKRFDRISSRFPTLPELEEFGKVLSDAMRVIVAEAEMLKSLVQEFSRFARLPICRPREVQPHDLIEKTLGLYDGGLEHLRIEKRFDPRIRLAHLDPEQMQRVFVNLIDNALDSLAEVNGERTLGIETHLNPDRGSLTIEFRDNGRGLADPDFENLFLPYFSTKKKGTGLGLAIVRQIISEHGGFIRAEANHPRGMRVIMELPAG